MILRDTNHVSILSMPPSERRTRLVERMTLSHDQHFGIPVVAVEETMRGWLAAIAKERLARRQVAAYRELSSLFEFFATFLIAPFDQAAADLFDSLQSARVRRGVTRSAGPIGSASPEPRKGPRNTGSRA